MERLLQCRKGVAIFYQKGDDRIIVIVRIHTLVDLALPKPRFSKMHHINLYETALRCLKT